jgi:predicted negative regulator of RcsB-dependent stress response
MAGRLPYRPTVRLASGLTAALTLAIPMAAANTDNETLIARGIVGEWSYDCSRPPGSDNQTVEFSASKGENAPTKMVRTGERELRIQIRDVRILPDAQIRWLEVHGNGMTFDVITRVVDNRMMGWQSIGNDGKPYIKDGFMTLWGRNSPWLAKCPGPREANAAGSMWQACKREQNNREAIKICSEIIRVQPNNAAAYAKRAFALSTGDKFDDALADYSEAIRLAPDYASAYNGRAWVQLKKGNAALGLTDANRALELIPDEPALLDTRGHIFDALGRRDEAIADYRKAISLAPPDLPQIQETKKALRQLEMSR